MKHLHDDPGSDMSRPGQIIYGLACLIIWLAILYALLTGAWIY